MKDCSNRESFCGVTWAIATPDTGYDLWVCWVCINVAWLISLGDENCLKLQTRWHPWILSDCLDGSIFRALTIPRLYTRWRNNWVSVSPSWRGHISLPQLTSVRGRLKKSGLDCAYHFPLLSCRWNGKTPARHDLSGSGELLLVSSIAAGMKCTSLAPVLPSAGSQRDCRNKWV